MISSNFDIQQFSELATQQDYLELISIANQEATEAERLLYQKNRDDFGKDENRVLNYVQCLKDLIWYMRYGFMPKMNDNRIGDLFDEICRKVSRNDRPKPRCADKLAKLTKR
jgi:hypothetical protein